MRRVKLGTIRFRFFGKKYFFRETKQSGRVWFEPDSLFVNGRETIFSGVVNG